MQETASVMRKGRVVEPLARKKGWEAEAGAHRSRVEKLEGNAQGEGRQAAR